MMTKLILCMTLHDQPLHSHLAPSSIPPEGRPVKVVNNGKVIHELLG